MYHSLVGIKGRQVNSFLHPHFVLIIVKISKIKKFIINLVGCSVTIKITSYF